MATHSSVLAWRIPGTAGPGGLPSMGLHRVGHDGSDLAAAVAASQIVQEFSFPNYKVQLFLCNPCIYSKLLDSKLKGKKKVVLM